MSSKLAGFENIRQDKTEAPVVPPNRNAISEHGGKEERT